MLELKKDDTSCRADPVKSAPDDVAASKRLDAIRLARVHARVSEHPIRAAIWIRQDDDALQLVEVIAGFPDDLAAHEPVACGTTTEIPRDVYLTVGNGKSLRESVCHRQEFRGWLAGGEVVYQDGDEGDRLIQFARGKPA